MTGVFALLKPFAWLAAVAFVSGFLGYLALGHPDTAVASASDVQASIASGPASNDWNLPKHI
jgi:hypothetical protein